MTQALDVAWSVAIFSSREPVARLRNVVAACRAACRARPAVIDVIVNGNADLAAAIRKELGQGGGAPDGVSVRVWHVALGDKAHAWNTYVYQIWPGGAVTFFLDGYVELHEDALEKLDAALAANPHATAASGVDVLGRSADRMIRFQIATSAIHGNLYALRRPAVLQVRDSGFRVPLGLYRSDTALESCLKYNFDPSTQGWDQHRVVVVPDANWNRPVLSPWKRSDWRVQWRRMVKQAQGDMEMQALKTFWAIDRKRPHELPRTAAELFRGWIRRFPGRWRRLVIANPLRWLAVQRVCRPHDWQKCHTPPELMGRA